MENIMKTENDQFSYNFIEQEAFNYLLNELLPDRFAEYTAKNIGQKFNLALYLKEREISKVGFITSFEANDFIDSKLLLNHKISYISGIYAVINKGFLLDVIYFFREGMLDSIEFASLGEALPLKVTKVQLLTTEKYDELMSEEAKKPKNIEK